MRETEEEQLEFAPVQLRAGPVGPLRLLLVAVLGALMALSLLSFSSASHAEAEDVESRALPDLQQKLSARAQGDFSSAYLNLVLGYEPDASQSVAERLHGTGAVLLKDLKTLSMVSVRIRADAVDALLERDFVVERVLTAAKH